MAAKYRRDNGYNCELDRLAAPAWQWLLAARPLSAGKAVNYHGWSGAAMAANSSH